MPDVEYIRLTRLRRRRGRWVEALTRYSSLWLGPDHLLSIESNRLTEEYKRFYFRDIQSLTIMKTSRREGWNAALGLLLLACVAWTLAGSTTGMVFAVLMGIGLIVNNVLGMTCTVFLQTAVQVEELSSLCRVSRAHSAIDRIRPLIAAAQGELTREAALSMNKAAFDASPTAQSGRMVTGPLNLSR